MIAIKHIPCTVHLVGQNIEIEGFAWWQPPLILGRDLKISDQNNWGEPEQNIKFGGDLNFSGGPMNMVVKGRNTPLF